MNRGSNLKQVFAELYRRAELHRTKTGDDAPLSALDSGTNNANDTYPTGETNPDYWRLALASIAEVVTAESRKWFTAQGWII